MYSFKVHISKKLEQVCISEKNLSKLNKMKTLERKARMKFQTQIKNFINRMHKHIMELPVERKVGLK